jgi:hypothetical protein
MVLQSKFVDKFLILQKFGINKSMRVMICFSNIPNKVNKKCNDLLPFWQYPRNQNFVSIFKKTRKKVPAWPKPWPMP